MGPLNYRQRLFVEHYLGESSGSAIDAARRAGYRCPQTHGPRLLTTRGVRAAIDARVETAAIPANEVLARIADVATSDLLNFIEVDNNGGWKVDLKLVKRLGLTRLGSRGLAGTPSRRGDAMLTSRTLRPCALRSWFWEPSWLLPQRQAHRARMKQRRWPSTTRCVRGCGPRPTLTGGWPSGVPEHGLQAEAELHFGEVVRLDPKRDAAWRKLGFKKINGRWMSDAQIAAEKAQREANKTWGPRLQKLHDALHDQKTHADAAAELSRIEAPAAVPSVWNVFGRGGAGDQLIAVQLLGQIRSPASSQLLAILAVFSPSATVRGRATETLRDRDPDDYAPGLISLIRKPLRYEIRPIQGPGSTGALFVEGERADLRRFYSAPPPEMEEFSGPLPDVPSEPLWELRGRRLP